MTYRILFSPDGVHWIDNASNNRKDPTQAYHEAREVEVLFPVRIVNVKTGQVIYETSKERMLTVCKNSCRSIQVHD